MFTLFCITDYIEVSAEFMDQNFREVVTVHAEKKYVSKFWNPYGVPVGIFALRILEAVLKSDLILVKVEIELVVFKPVIDEVLVGKIRNCNKAGIIADLGFFEVLIPARNLAEPSK